MTYLQKLDAGEDFEAKRHATYGPETEKGYPVKLDMYVELNHRMKDGWCLSISGGLRIKACEKLGLVPVETGGQCLDNVVKYLDRCGLVCPTWNSIVPIWREWPVLLAWIMENTPFVSCQPLRAICPAVM